ncbi:transporter substrate-binding domain-containing protein [Xanthobacter sp. V4C-4]|uniref:transporter substrate-binding domain-containing protein n=1 Tax=Xanthobacter cornucopiae TaxID=3119924 RepID=UPI003728E43A
MPATVRAVLIVGGLTAALLLAASRREDAPARAFAGSTLRVGVEWLPPPETPETRPYTEAGFELDLASELAQGVGAGLRLVRVAPESAARALAEGEVDVVLARLDRDDLRLPEARIVETGFRSGLSLAVRTDRPLSSWNELRGKVVCVAAANRHAHDLAERLGAKVKAQRAPALALMQVRTGTCDAALHDRALLDPLFAKVSWQKFSATLPQVEQTRLVAAVAPGAPALARAIAEVLASGASAERWRQRGEQWASTVAFEVYRDQDAPDCH